MWHCATVPESGQLRHVGAVRPDTGPMRSCRTSAGPARPFTHYSGSSPRGHLALAPDGWPAGAGWRVIMTADLATSITRGIPAEGMEHLDRHHVVTLSTSSFTGMPHADTVVYTSDAHNIFFFAGEGTQMLRNLKDSRRVSFTIDDYTIDWRKVRELQGVGRCLPAGPEQDNFGWNLYVAKFGKDAMRPPGGMHLIVPN